MCRVVPSLTTLRVEIGSQTRCHPTLAPTGPLLVGRGAEGPLIEAWTLTPSLLKMLRALPLVRPILLWTPFAVMLVMVPGVRRGIAFTRGLIRVGLGMLCREMRGGSGVVGPSIAHGPRSVWL